MRIRLPQIAAVLLLVAAPIASAQENGPISTGDQAIGDREIDARIEGIFDEIDGLQGVFVTVHSGVVTLRGKVREAALANQAEQLASRVNGVVAVTNEIREVTSLPLRLEPVYQRLRQRGAQAIGYLPLLAVALATWAAIYLVGWFAARRAWPWERIAPNAFIADLLRQLVRLLFLVIGAVMALDILGATALLGTILGAAGIVGLAIGFAVRDTVENYIASILLSIRQPFRPKDYIRIGDLEGSVISLTSRATILLDVDGNHIRIPNATVFKSNIVNYSRNPQRRFLFKVGVGPDSNLDVALETGLSCIRSLDFVIENPGPDAWIEDIGAYNVVLTFTGWIDQNVTAFLKARSEALRLTKLALEGKGFSLPAPTYQLQVRRAAPGIPAPKAAEVPPVAVRQTPAASEETTAAADTSPDAAVIQKVEEEHTHATRHNLLSETAPDELDG
ncbi:MAG: mechanosensitive ion channel family protein [Oricola sp.]